MDATVMTEVAAGLAKLADAVHHLRQAQGDMEAGLRSARHGSEAEAVALGMARVLAHLGEAVADVTPEMWAMMLSEENVGIEEVRKALEAAA